VTTTLSEEGPVSRASRAYLLLGVLGALVYVPLGPAPAGMLLALSSGSAVVAVLVGVRMHRPEQVLPWYLLAAGMGGFVGGDLVYSWYDTRGVPAPFPGPADVFYLAAYPLLLAAVGLVVHTSGTRDSAAWLDAGMWTVGAVVAAWLPLMSPFVHDPDLTVPERLTALSYPFLDLVLLLLVIQQLSHRARRAVPHRLLLLSLTALLVTDAVYGIRSLDGSYVSGEATDVGWLVCYVAAGAAALHPGMRLLTGRSQPAVSHQRGFTLFLITPALVAPAVLVLLLLRGSLTGDRSGGLVVAVASAVVFVLSALRVRALIRELRARELVLEATLRDREALAEELRSRATRCPLTGLVNRTGFMELVTGALEAADPMAVGLLDLDDFKGVNDTLGHDAGDTLLVEVATRLRGAVGPRDVVGRLGGDEFAVLLRGDVHDTASRLVEVLGAPLLLDGQELRVEASLGVVERTDQSSLGDLLRRADVAMYAAKAAGGNRWLGYRTEMSDSVQRRLDLRTQLVLALERQEIVPWFQPVVDLASGDLVGFEALARWNRLGREDEGPADWISLAEQTGLVVPIDFAVLEAALRELARWREATSTARDLKLAVNTSGRTLQEPGTAARVLALLARTGIPAEALVLEVTEGVLLEDDAVGRRLQHLRQEGVRIALDDFGTGWSSLSYLTRFPVDVLKLDRSFTATLDDGPGGVAVPAAVVQLARALDLEVVAEGIEREEQAARLEVIGAQHGQGYLFGRPVPAEVVMAMLHEREALADGLAAAAAAVAAAAAP
jgi:diguanylate cyclase (GGDEF)-like protein